MPISAERQVKSLSVVVPSVNGWGDLEGCLEALEGQRNDADLDVLVVDRLGDGIRDQVRRRFPQVTVIPAPAGTTIPDLRAMAFEQAKADSVAVIEDHVIVPPGWAAQLLAAQARGEEVVGGSVDNAATGRLVDWAAFLCEYSQLLPPLPEGPVQGLTGNNTVYRKALLEKHRDTARAGRWENYLHDALRRDGVVLYQRPEIRVGHKKHYTVWEYLSQRFLYARSYAGVRVEGAPLHAATGVWIRGVCAAADPVLQGGAHGMAKGTPSFGAVAFGSPARPLCVVLGTGRSDRLLVRSR